MWPSTKLQLIFIRVFSIQGGEICGILLDLRSPLNIHTDHVPLMARGEITIRDGTSAPPTTEERWHLHCIRIRGDSHRRRWRTGGRRTAGGGGGRWSGRVQLFRKQKGAVPIWLADQRTGGTCGANRGGDARRHYGDRFPRRRSDNIYASALASWRDGSVGVTASWRLLVRAGGGGAWQKGMNVS